ncbi:MAG: FAD-binding oxidoreductase [Candidatus Cloacimonetes bacterium]|nr:FAD-binding oxidoreductase [Candidatus Cloacimonadota bacterium]MCF7814877.1 FAD-binding oxidoreductase [Candidatus Cloacimonadota bacterium]MCF7868152.1 FAD-binding oxidoreductase [Candidatus Cloacimonadota bacterium]MCF7884574.1 FAD-binding oxidoreductase [Candidatus Cloacimonadota bacterium]
MSNYDVIIIGAGSVGVPTAMALAEKKLKVLVIDSLASAGQANNKKAIGGIRATHSDFGKIKVCQRSIEIFRTWEEKFGDDIGWISGGYSFPAYTKDIERTLKELMKIQHSFGLNIKWISPEEYQKLVPGINMNGLLGSTYSPEDGSASPLLSMNAFYFKSLEYGAEYKFKENVIDLKLTRNKSTEVVTDKGKYSADFVINAAGNYAKDIGKMVGMNLPVNPDNHEAGITEPVARFFEPMVVDLRKAPGSANYYFYQNNEGQVVFCITPDPPIVEIDNDATSEFLPLCTKRMIDIYPRLTNLKVRRTWRGQYPMTPDGFPIVAKTKEIPNLINAVGMCGQGFMLGPGLGELISRIVTNELSDDDNRMLESFDQYRDFSGMEKFK